MDDVVAHFSKAGRRPERCQKPRLLRIAMVAKHEAIVCSVWKLSSNSTLTKDPRIVDTAEPLRNNVEDVRHGDHHKLPIQGVEEVSVNKHVFTCAFCRDPNMYTINNPHDSRKFSDAEKLRLEKRDVGVIRPAAPTHKKNYVS